MIRVRARKGLQSPVSREQCAVSSEQCEIKHRLPTAHSSLPTLLNDPSTTDNFIAAIEHGRLARRDGALRLVELNRSTIVCKRSDRRGCRRVPVTDAHFGA